MKKPSSKKPASAQPVPVLQAGTWQNKSLLLLLSIAFIFYFNTCFNGYALDDHLVITKNSYTKQGISGIPDLVKKTSYYGFFKNNNEEVTLRYRPLVMITYALECQFFKNEKILTFFSHLVNVLIFILSAYVLYRLNVEFIFRDKKEASFLATLLFVIHPIHTESVANIKGRDELLSFLLAMLSIYLLFSHLRKNSLSTYILSVICFTAGLFSKESIISFLLVIPCMIYFFTKLPVKEAVRKTLPYFGVALLYLAIRFAVTGWPPAPSGEVLNNPFLGATAVQKAATILFSLGCYIKLLFYPHPLSYDYTFNQIMLVDFTNAWVWVSLVFHLFLVVVAVTGIKKKSPVSFGILFYFITIFLVTNIVVNLGAFIGERLVYTPSFGFCLVMAVLLTRLMDSLPKGNPMAIRWTKVVLVAILVLTAGAKTVSRNADWKNNFTLMTRDAEVSTESMKANDACAVTLILETDKEGMTEEKRKELLLKAIHHDHKAAEIMPSFTDIYLNLGVAYSRLENADSAEFYWNVARSQKPSHAKLVEYDPVLGQLFLTRGLKRAVDKDMNGCIADLSKAVRYAHHSEEAWYNYGGALFSVGRTVEARDAFIKVLEINPGHEQARLGLNSLSARQ